MTSSRNLRTKENTRPIVVDLFAGAGGLSLAFEQAGFYIAAAVEIDPIHCAIHHYNFPQTATICASVVNLSGEDIRRRAEIGKREIDVLCGGAPCQGFSLMGRRALDDPRNQLVFHFVRLVSELRPKYFVFENVKGLTVGTHKRFLNEVVEEMKAAGHVTRLRFLFARIKSRAT
jgi:DNA (cytosine-5)-methyltransferase 1